MIRTCPILMTLFGSRLFAAASARTVIPKRAAIEDKESPDCTTYVRGVGWAAGLGVAARGVAVGVAVGAGVGEVVGEVLARGVGVGDGRSVARTVRTLFAGRRPNPCVEAAAAAAPLSVTVAVEAVPPVTVAVAEFEKVNEVIQDIYY